MITKCSINVTLKISASERDLFVKSPADLEDKESFTANIGTDKKIFSYKGRYVISHPFACNSILGIRTLYKSDRFFFVRFFFGIKKQALLLLGSEKGLNCVLLLFF